LSLYNYCNSRTGVGDIVTAIGGIALDSNIEPKSGLVVKVFDGPQLIAESQQIGPDGFYFVEVPPTSESDSYQVKLINEPKSKKKSDQVIAVESVSVAQDEFVSVNFTQLSPADPVIEGYVFDSNAQGVSDVTINVYRDTSQEETLFASTETVADGTYYDLSSQEITP